MRQIRLRKIRRRLGLYEAPASAPKPMDPGSVMQRRRVFETLPDYPECPDGWHPGPDDIQEGGACGADSHPGFCQHGPEHW